MRRFALALVLMVSSGIVTSAQSTTATISGTIQDEYGGVLRGATVVVRSLDSGALRSTTSDTRGAFQVLALPPGTYLATFELPGFASSTQNIALTLNQHLR